MQLLENFKLLKIKWLTCVAWITITIQLLYWIANTLEHSLTLAWKEK